MSSLRKPKGGIDLKFIMEVCKVVFNELGIGHNEKVYQRGIGTVLDKLEIFNRLEVIAPTYMLDNVVGSGRIDVVVGRLVLELKAVTSLPSRASGQLLKYLKSINKIKIDEFKNRHVKSAFFVEAGEKRKRDADVITDEAYAAELDAAMKDLYTGVVINFNQRTGDVQVGCVIQPDRADLINAHKDAAAAVVIPFVSEAEAELSAEVAKFVRCCMDITNDPSDTVPLRSAARAYEEFTGGKVPALRVFKAELASHVPVERTTEILGNRSFSAYSGVLRDVCVGARLVG